MKIWILENKKIFNELDEIIVKVDFNNKIGFHCYSSWEKLGQRPMSTLRKDLKTFKSEMIAIAWKDAFIFQNYKESSGFKFLNHSFFLHDLTSFSSNTLKLKLSGDKDNDLDLVSSEGRSFSKLRLDANYKYNFDEFLSFWKEIGINQRKVEYIEDPIFWDEDNYKKLIDHKVPIALDQIFNNQQIVLNVGEKLVLKPMLQSVNSAFYKKCIFSHNMNGILSDWQTFCELLRLGDMNEIHGVASNSTFDNKLLFLPNGEYVEVNTELIKAVYDYLYCLRNWERVV